MTAVRKPKQAPKVITDTMHRLLNCATDHGYAIVCVVATPEVVSGGTGHLATFSNCEDGAEFIVGVLNSASRVMAAAIASNDDGSRVVH